MSLGMCRFSLAAEWKRELPLAGMSLCQSADATTLAILRRLLRKQRADLNLL